jgi:hypothetical protein
MGNRSSSDWPHQKRKGLLSRNGHCRQECQKALAGRLLGTECRDAQTPWLGANEVFVAPFVGDDASDCQAIVAAGVHRQALHLRMVFGGMYQTKQDIQEKRTAYCLRISF